MIWGQMYLVFHLWMRIPQAHGFCNLYNRPAETSLVFICMPWKPQVIRPELDLGPPPRGWLNAILVRRKLIHWPSLEFETHIQGTEKRLRVRTHLPNDDFKRNTTLFTQLDLRLSQGLFFQIMNSRDWPESFFVPNYTSYKIPMNERNLLPTKSTQSSVFRYTEENEIEESGVTLKQAAAEGTEVKNICI